MALALGTNVGFVTTSPTVDPAGSDTVSDGSSFVVKDTAPAGAVKITEVGWYKGVGTTSSNTQVGLYAADGATVPGEAGTRLQVTGDQASGTSAGWIKFTGLNWPITAGTVYWLGMQQDAHTGSSDIDSAASGGSGIDTRTSQTALTDPYGGGALADTDGMYAIYAVYQVAPTVSLSTPADSATGVSTTPDLVFTGTDAQSDDVRYEVQVDTVSTLGSGSEAVCDSYSESNWVDGTTPLSSDATQWQGEAQSFTGDGKTLSKVQWYLKVGAGSPTGNAVAKIYAHSGTFGTSSVLTGSALATSDNFDVSTLTGTFGLKDFTFSGANRITLTNGIYYVATIEYSGGDSSNYIRVGSDYTSPTHTGNESSLQSGSWTPASGYDEIFYVYTASALIDAVSGTDAGFSGTTDSVVTDSYSESNSSSTAQLWNGHEGYTGQSFKPTIGGFLTSVKFHLNKTGSPTGNANVRLYAHSGTYGVDGIPTGSPLATSDNFDVSTLTGTKALTTFTFSTPYALTANTAYCIILSYAGTSDSSNFIGFGNDGSSPTHGGVYIYSNDASTWNVDTPSDACFYTYTTMFTSGTATTYTVQSALSNSTVYYWRVRGIDPSGSNTYGAWATTRSFTTAAAGGVTVKTLATLGVG